MRQLTGYDFIAMRVITDHPGISIRQLHERINTFITDRGVTAEHAVTKKHKRSTEFALRRLRDVGYVTPAPLIEATSTSREMWNWIDEWWKTWPYYVPIEDGKVMYAQMKER